MSALEEYRERVTVQYDRWNRGEAVTADFGMWGVKDLADDAIAELEAENVRLMHLYDCENATRIAMDKRAEKTEAERESWEMTARAAGALAESYQDELAALLSAHAKHHPSCEDCGDVTP
jgi:hypothetical protein